MFLFDCLLGRCCVSGLLLWLCLPDSACLLVGLCVHSFVCLLVFVVCLVVRLVVGLLARLLVCLRVVDRGLVSLLCWFAALCGCVFEGVVFLAVCRLDCIGLSCCLLVWLACCMVVRAFVWLCAGLWARLMVCLRECMFVRAIVGPVVGLRVCSFVWLCGRVLVCLLGRLLGWSVNCVVGRLHACLLVWLFAWPAGCSLGRALVCVFACRSV